MGIKWHSQPLSTVIDNTGKEAMHKATWAVNNIVNMVLSKGAEHMKNTIATTPSSIVPGKKDRIDTGTMRDSVDVIPMKRSGSGRNNYEGSVGWVWVELDYFQVQDQGGMSSGLRRGNRQITPMHALSKAYFYMEKELQDELGHL